MTTALISLADRKEIARKIFHDRVKSLHGYLSVTSLPATLLCATLVYLCLYHLENKTLILSWYLAVIAVSVLRLGLTKWYQQDTEHPAFHLKLFTLGTLLSGILWGAAGSILAPPNSILPRVFVIIIIAGLNAGGCQTLRASKTANSLFMLTSIVPLALWALFQDQEIYTYLSLALFGYLIFMLAIAHKSYVQYINALQLRYENELLLKHLKDTNEELHQEIIGHEKAKNQLRYLASHDFLTGIDNRFSFDAEFDRILSAAQSENSEFCVMFIDIDHFKTINDNSGHAFGDRILIEVALQLRKHLRSQDRLARIGGDEFIVLMPDSQVKPVVDRFLRDIYAVFSTPFQLDGHSILLSVSIGGSFFPQDGDSKKTLLKKADVALYRAKMLGRNRYEYYQEEMKVFE